MQKNYFCETKTSKTQENESANVLVENHRKDPVPNRGLKSLSVVNNRVYISSAYLIIRDLPLLEPSINHVTHHISVKFCLYSFVIRPDNQDC